ncbi:hypothetical protein [Myxosarcina sp. GI1]|uniref:hypothetical protein n=1 Tax=Myxosarcina sp. GI1 TaxID=1541065 RepID=UPI00056BE21D|nr:hypothetical protein [Myxosarcina sp. GI1]
MFFSRLLKFTQTLPFVWFSCLTGVIILQCQQYRDFFTPSSSNNYYQEEQEQKRLVNAQQQLPGLDYDNIVADWTYLNFIQYYGDKPAREQTGHSLVTDYFKTISSFDPRFSKAYLTLSTANTIHAGKPEETIILMEKVLKSVSPESPEAALLWTAKGLDELLYLGDIQAAKNSYKTAADLASIHGESGAELAVRYRNTAEFLAQNPDITEAQILAWSLVLPNIRDKQHRQEIITKIDELKSKLQTAQETEQ